MAVRIKPRESSHHGCRLFRSHQTGMCRSGVGAAFAACILVQMIVCGGAHLQRQLDCIPSAATVGPRRHTGHLDTVYRRRSRRSSRRGSTAEMCTPCFAPALSFSAANSAHVSRGTSTSPPPPTLPPPGFKSASRRRHSSRTARRRRAGDSARVAVFAVAGQDLSAESRPRGTRGERESRTREEERDREAQQQSRVGGPGACEDPMKTRLGKELDVCRVINGLCQGPLDDTSGNPTDALRSMDRLAETGLTTFQLGNGAGGGRALAERRAGSYLKSAAGAASGYQEVRFLNTLSLRPGVAVTRKAVKAELELSLRRMGVERLDLVQLCWRDFEDKYFLDALYFLQESECVSNVGVCGFPSDPLALAARNGFTIVSNLVSSSLIMAPEESTRTSFGTDGKSGKKGSSSSSGGGGGEITLARQCRKQGVALISSGASLGGFAAEEWLHRSPPSPSGARDEELPPGARQALSEILAWGSGGRGSGNSNDDDETRDGRLQDPWRLYQEILLPELQAVARKHGRGLSPADVATAYQLYRKPVPDSTGVPGSSGVHRSRAGDPGNPEANAGSSRIDSAPEASAAAVSIPVRVNSAGSLSARRSAEADGDRVSGRRGAELSEMLDAEDVERIAEAVAAGDTTSAVRRKESALGWDEALSEGAEGERDRDEEIMLGGVEVGWEGPTIFL